MMSQADLYTQLLMRFTKFFSKCARSKNSVVYFCARLAMRSNSSVGSNASIIRDMFNVDSSAILSGHCFAKDLLLRWFEFVTEEDIHSANFICELLQIRDGCLWAPLEAAEVRFLLDFICTM